VVTMFVAHLRGKARRARITNDEAWADHWENFARVVQRARSTAWAEREPRPCPDFRFPTSPLQRAAGRRAFFPARRAPIIDDEQQHPHLTWDPELLKEFDADVYGTYYDRWDEYDRDLNNL
jgi:hypothetical protein